MAHLILTPIAGRIIGSLGSAAVREISSLWGVNDELDELEDTMSAIKDVLLDAEEKQLHSHQVRNWLQRLGVAVHIADDLMDEFKTEALRRQLMSGNELSKQVLPCHEY
ncbi:hypothetical protein TIFTF001_024588 [Ficus carica]|uniref:Disease resistance N-terminal domain-containing protein n=1 Tax=Ficus carica TaxID=3494 RepID=A0AA88DKE3_FICCA|nr:hypothetical protein TIFTF001_024588 [Ficus carica]